MRRIALTLIAFIGLSGLALAHGDGKHVRGTVAQITDKAITIQMAGKKTTTVTLLADTTFVKSGAAAAVKDLKVGDRVVVDVVIKDKEMMAKIVKFGATRPAKKPAEHQSKTGQH